MPSAWGGCRAASAVGGKARGIGRLRQINTSTATDSSSVAPAASFSRRTNHLSTERDFVLYPEGHEERRCRHEDMGQVHQQVRHRWQCLQVPYDIHDHIARIEEPEEPEVHP